MKALKAAVGTGHTHTAGAVIKVSTGCGTGTVTQSPSVNHTEDVASQQLLPSPHPPPKLVSGDTGSGGRRRGLPGLSVLGPS